MEEIKFIIGFVQSIGFTGLLVILAVPKLRRFFGFNGNNKISEDIRDNHIHELKDTLAKISDKMDASCKKLDRIDDGLRKILEDGVRIKE